MWIPSVRRRAMAVVVILLATPFVGAANAQVSAGAPPDTAFVEYSEWYARRLKIHRRSSYAMLPMFAAQFAAGRELMAKSSDAPRWATRWHGPLATGVAVLFTANTVTGAWNLWAARKDPAARKWRTTHSLLMLASDAGFTAAGLRAERAERSASARREHRDIAFTSIGVATIAYVMMLPPLRRD
jgi:hypothetical protein